MKTINLGEKPNEGKATTPHGRYYPTIYYSDDGVAGVSSFDDSDIGKKITVQAQIRLKAIASRDVGKGQKHFNYDFEVLSITMPDDLSKQQSTETTARQEKKAKAQAQNE